MQKILITLLADMTKIMVAAFLLLCLIQLAVWATGYDLSGSVFSKESFFAPIAIYTACALLSRFVNSKFNNPSLKGEK